MPADPDRKIYEAVIEDVRTLGGHLRQSDLDEIAASSGCDPTWALEFSFHHSTRCWTAICGGKVVGMWGVCGLSLMSDIGVPWLLGSDEIENLGIEVARHSRYYVGEMMRGFSILENHIDARQVRSIRWLHWLGFTIDPPRPWGVKSLPFHRFHMEASNV